MTLIELSQFRCVEDLMSIAYSVYGVGSNNACASLIRFKGEWQDSITRCYLLGNGLRVFCPFIMRFISPDHLSPFSQGGLNSYAFCENDPVNFNDPSGCAKTKMPSPLTPPAKARIRNPASRNPWIPEKPYALKELSGHSMAVGSGDSVAGTSRTQAGNAAIAPSQPVQDVLPNAPVGSTYSRGGWRSSKASADFLIAANAEVTAPTARNITYTTEHLRQAMYYAIENKEGFKGYVDKYFLGDKRAWNSIRAQISRMETRVLTRSVRGGE